MIVLLKKHKIWKRYHSHTSNNFNHDHALLFWYDIIHQSLKVKVFCDKFVEPHFLQPILSALIVTPDWTSDLFSLFSFYKFIDIGGKGGCKVEGSHYHCYPRFRPTAQSSIGQTQELSPANIITQFHLLQNDVQSYFFLTSRFPPCVFPLLESGGWQACLWLHKPEGDSNS